MLPLDPEIEHTLRQRRREVDQEQNMADNQPLRDFACPTYDGSQQGIRAPNVEAKNFEIKPAIINMVQQEQFGGLPFEDPVEKVYRNPRYL